MNEPREIGARRPGLLRPGQRPLRRFNAGSLLLAIPGLVASGVLATRVPDTHLAEAPEGAAQVTCVCGALPIEIHPTSFSLCECGRVFVHLGGERDVRVVKTEPQEGEE